MRVIAIDASTDWCSVAASDGHACAVRELLAGQAHSERVLPMVREAVDELGWELGALDAIAFGAGPGSFTGVRIACGVAQGLAFGLARPVMPVGTLEALAEESWRRRGASNVLACLDARMREVYVAAYRRDGDAWREVAAPAVLAPADVRLPDANEAWTGAGGGFAAYPELASRLRLTAVHADVRPSARSIAALALPRLVAGRGVRAADALPLYVRHRVALTTAERAAGARL
jgi:tRNA threonylcarbamoyladenosine biosynthesis protein TsaB